MIQELLGLDINNIEPHHKRVLTELQNYNYDISINIQVFTEYDENYLGLTKSEWLNSEQEILYTIIGTSTALLWLYNRIEKFEYSHELHTEMKDIFVKVMNEIYPNNDNEGKFHELLDKMFQSFNEIFI